MAERKVWLVVVLSLIAIMIGALTVSASDWHVNWTFSKNPVRQSENVQVTMVFKNTNDNQMKLKYLGIHFDWMQTNYYYCSPDGRGDPISLATGQTTTQTVTASMDKDIVTVGFHSYYFYADYDVQDGWFGGWNTYNSSTSTSSDFRVLERDRDGDGVADSDDAFPDNPLETKDSDKDGVGDNSDAFPLDSKEWKDSDGDGHGDNSDAFPNDPKRWESGDILGTGNASYSMAMILGGIAAIAIVIIIVVLVFIVRKRRSTMAQSAPQVPSQAAPSPSIVPLPSITEPVKPQSSPPPSSTIGSLQVCAACGSRLQGGERFCPSCGKPV